MKSLSFSRLIVLCIASFVVNGCGSQLNQLALQWNPYKRWDMLIFESEKKETDSVFIRAIIASKSGEDEVLKVMYEIPSASKNTTGSAAANCLLQLRLAPNAEAWMHVQFAVKHAAPAAFSASLHRLDSLPKNSIEIDMITYRDVIELEPDSTVAGFANLKLQNNFVEKIYWSKSQGLIRYRLKNGSSFTLVKKYNL